MTCRVHRAGGQPVGSAKRLSLATIVRTQPASQASLCDVADEYADGVAANPFAEQSAHRCPADPKRRRFVSASPKMSVAARRFVSLRPQAARRRSVAVESRRPQCAPSGCRESSCRSRWRLVAVGWMTLFGQPASVGSPHRGSASSLRFVTSDQRGRRSACGFGATLSRVTRVSGKTASQASPVTSPMSTRKATGQPRRRTVGSPVLGKPRAMSVRQSLAEDAGCREASRFAEATGCSTAVEAGVRRPTMATRLSVDRRHVHPSSLACPPPGSL